MHADTHKAITLAVTSALGIENSRSRRIAEAATTPDISPDYVKEKYRTRSGRERTRWVRVSHHGTPLSLLEEIAVEARHSLLEGKRDKADYMLGRLLHYLQDRPIPSPDVNKHLHDSFERECSKLNPISFMKKVEENCVIPVGKTETLKVLSRRKVASTPEEAMEEALKNSLSIASSILSSIFAPPKFSSLGKEVYDFFKSRSKEMFLYSLLQISLIIPFSIGVMRHDEPMLSLGYAFPRIIQIFVAFLIGIFIYDGICILTVALSSDMNKVLYKARRINDHIAPSSILSIFTATCHIIIPIIVILVSLLIYFRFFKFPTWKAIKEEIDWYIWK
ncbi:MAG: hypothetical protein LM601_07570 [Candidatus Verstraetearchaeota archaeon]|jgi:hypothetical protein|nr:hypothetical protein [Candidatus Verstraetearchaeota archaeon]